MPRKHILTIAEETGTREITLTLPFYVIGTAPDCNILLTCIFVSPFHATLNRLTDADGSTKYLFTDGISGGKPSRNGSLINGRRMANYVLYDGDIINLGPMQLEYTEQDI